MTSLLFRAPREEFVSVFEWFGTISGIWNGGSGPFGFEIGGFQLMLQSSQFDSVAFDSFSFQKDGLASAEVDVGRCQVL